MTVLTLLGTGEKKDDRDAVVVFKERKQENRYTLNLSLGRGRRLVVLAHRKPKHISYANEASV